MPKKKKSNIKGRPPKLGSFKKNVQDEFNSFIVKSVGYCQKCGRGDRLLNCSHVKSIGAYPNLRFDIMNVLCLCSMPCHLYWWHDEPTEAGKWFEEKFPERTAYLEKAKNIPRQFTLDDLREIRQAIKNRDVKKLYISIDILKKL